MLWCHLALLTHLLFFTFDEQCLSWVIGQFHGLLHWRHPHFFKDHGRPLTHIHFVLKKFWKVGLYAKLKKCEYHQSEMEFLGDIIFRDGIHMDPSKVQTIVDWVILTCVWDAQCFFGFTNFYRHFIAHYSSIMAFFIRLTKKDQPFFREIEVNNVFQYLKAFFMTTPLLINVDPSKPFVLEMDTYDFAVNIMLSQLEKDNLFIFSAYVFIIFFLQRWIMRSMIKNF